MDEQTPQHFSQPAGDPVYETGPQPQRIPAADDSAGGRMTLGDIYYTLFRHKWKIITLTLAGIVLAAAAHMYWPVTYASFAKVVVRGVQNISSVGLAGNSSASKDADRYGETIVDTEKQILSSFNLCLQVAQRVGPERILNLPPGEVTVEGAAMAIARGVVVTDNRDSTVLQVQFRHQNREIVQPVLQALLEEYRVKRATIYNRMSDFSGVLQDETEKLRLRLSQIEAELQSQMNEAGVLSIDEAKKTYTQQISRLRQDLMDAEATLSSKRAIVSGAPPTTEQGETTPAAISPDIIREYQSLTATIDGQRKREQEYLLTYTPESSAVRYLTAEIARNEARRDVLETQHPQLATLRKTEQSNGLNAATAAARNYADEIAQITAIEARIKTITEQLARTRAEAARMSGVELTVSELERQRDLQAKNYGDLAAKLASAQMDRAIGGDSDSDIRVIEEPTIPVRETKKLMSTVYALLMGGLCAGLGLAFVIDMFLDQTVRRPSEVEGKLGLPLFLNIPHLNKNARTPANGSLPLLRGPDGAPGTKGTGAGSANLPATTNDGMRVFFEALRDRLIYYFEIRNLTRKPKLVAVTSCGKDAGVSTIAAGLAASLSETGDGNVLLVDMNPGQRAPHFFHKGDLKLGLTEALEQEKRTDARVRENLYMVSHTSSSGNNHLSRILPTKFTNLVPKLKASDYEYIIFDMPPVGQLSVTPQLARYMDMVFMVVESEETNRDAVKRASAMLTESGSKVSVVLNKTKNYLPRGLQQEYLNEA